MEKKQPTNYGDLKNIENYNLLCDFNILEACDAYINIILHYIKHNDLILKTINLYTFKGIEIICNIFLYTLLYTKNLKLTIETTHNATYLFVEYIYQIFNKDNEFVFVNLTINDAIMYVYRKTIFEINDNHKKKFKNSVLEKQIYEIITIFVKSYNLFIQPIIEKLKNEIDMNNKYEILDDFNIKFEIILKNKYLSHIPSNNLKKIEKKKKYLITFLMI